MDTTSPTHILCKCNKTRRRMRSSSSSSKAPPPPHHSQQQHHHHQEPFSQSHSTRNVRTELEALRLSGVFVEQGYLCTSLKTERCPAS
mmetsp:Transcript_8616/g.13967  ORF Transcript_8616/g.13967 Transcript_8616/m.13967 type:complete len:88 (-) Transcript_8616:889-1152(-)